MKITGENLGKKFGKNWVFRNIETEIQTGDSLAVTGPNGSGKSTLLKILSGYLSPSEGNLLHDDKALDVDVFKQISFCAPYLEVPEEMTLTEFLSFHSTFREPHYSIEEIAEKSQLPLHKRIADFSTGMKQRVQLSTAFYFKNEAVFMDEPTSNLDEQGFQWWKAEMAEKRDFTLILASNQRKEIEQFDKAISL